MNFNQALTHLGIEDYGDRIFNSSSTGELMHLADYIQLANHFKDPRFFRRIFEECVEFCERD